MYFHTTEYFHKPSKPDFFFFFLVGGTSRGVQNVFLRDTNPKKMPKLADFCHFLLERGDKGIKGGCADFTMCIFPFQLIDLDL